MPWSSQNGGGGWKSGGGGPWGQGPGSGGSGGDGPNQPDIEDLLKRSQDRLKKAMPGGQKGPSFIGGGLMTIIGLIGVVALLFLMFTVRVNTDEQGMVLRFGKFDRQLPPGIHFRFPAPVEEVLLPKVTQEKQMSVGVIRRGDRRFGPVADQDVLAESLMLTGDSNIVDIDFDIFWRIKDAKDYLFNIRNPELTVKAVAESAMREVVGKSAIQSLMTKDRLTAELAVKDLMQKTLDDYKSGIVVTRIKMTKVDPPAQVIDSFRDVQAAAANQETTKNQADAYANRVLEEAQGEAEKILKAASAYKEQTIAEARGEAGRFTKIYEEYRKAPEITRKRMFLETMERVFGGMDKVIIDSQGAGKGGVVPYLPLNELVKKKNQGGN